jgi:hypothetical protein
MVCAPNSIAAHVEKLLRQAQSRPSRGRSQTREARTRCCPNGPSYLASAPASFACAELNPEQGLQP